MHIGFIMDGNRRWAKARGIPESQQHEKGFANIEQVLDLCLQANLETVSMWGLSVDNIAERSKLELATIYRLLKNGVRDLAEKFRDKNARFDWAGDAALLPRDVVESLEYAKNITSHNTGMQCIFSIGYGGRHEIIQGVKKLLAEKADPSKITEESFYQALDTGRFPPLDLIIRTGGHQRHSGYFLYASEYSEYYFTHTMWPDFGKEDLDKALALLRGTQRNFGK